jgi:hypothetical protein
VGLKLVSLSNEGATSSQNLPPHFRNLTVYEIKTDWKKLLNELHPPYQTWPSPFMAPQVPTPFFSRNLLLDQVKHLLIHPAKDRGVKNGLSLF